MSPSPALSPPKKGASNDEKPVAEKTSTNSVNGKSAGQRRISPNSVQPVKYPVSSANADHPPQERQRVWRACAACKKKKVKCNGEEPCQTCIGYNLQCQYPDNHKKVDITYVENLESRLDSMESMFREFLERFQRDAMALPPANEQPPAINETRTEQPVHDSSENLANSPRLDGIAEHEFEQQNDVEDLFAPQCADDDRDTSTEAERRVIHADSFGELDMDENGELRYVGLGSMTALIDTCIGLRRHIYSGLERKGYLRKDNTLSSPQASYSPSFGNPSTPGQHNLVLQIPQAALVTFLIETWEKSLFNLFPVVHADELRDIYSELQTPGSFNVGSAAIVFALLAVCLPTARKLNADTLDKLLANYGDDPASQFYNTAKHFVDMPESSSQKSRRRSSKVLIALSLMSMYLTQIGSEAEAWITVGRAVRVGQDLGFHRSPEKLRLPRNEAQARRRIFWALYILDRQLSGALGRPLAINDEDCDVEFPDPEADSLEGFVAMAHLHKIIGNILRTVASVKNAQTWQNSEKYEELRSRVLTLNHQLRQWSIENVAEKIKDAQSQEMLVHRHIALSSFFSAVLTLHRLYMSNPHRTSPLENSQALLQCSKAATSCIRGTDVFLKCVPTSHYTLLHGHHCFVSATVLLHCIRAYAEPEFVQEALADVQEAVRCLRLLEPIWPGAEKCRGIVEEYIEFTLNVLENGKRGQCNFTHDGHDHHSSGNNSCGSFPSSATKRDTDTRRRRLVHQTRFAEPGTPSTKRKRTSLDNTTRGPPPRAPTATHSRSDPVTWLSNQSNSTGISPPTPRTTNPFLEYNNFHDLDFTIANSSDLTFGTASGLGGFPSILGLPDLGMDFCFPEFPSSLDYTKM